MNIRAIECPLSAPAMPPHGITHGKHALACALALFAGIAALYAALMVWGIVGIFTGVIGICSGAPHWWSVAFMWLTLLAIIPGFQVGRGTYRWFIEKEQDKLG